MPINPQHSGSFSFLDASNERSSMGFNFGPITALTIAGFLADFGDLRDATDAITIGALVQDQWTGDITKYNAAIPTNPSAQRERKFLVQFQGATSFSRYTVEIPTADFTGRMVAGTDLVDLTNTQVATWITAFEALCKTPEGEDVEVLAIRGVGRNL